MISKKKIFYNIKNLLLSKFTENHSKFILKHNIINDFEINNISSIENIEKDSFVFIKKNSFHKINLDSSLNKSNCLIFDDEIIYSKFKSLINVILVKNIDEIYKPFVETIYTTDDSLNFVDDFDFIEGSYISKYSSIGKSVLIYPGCFIGRGCEIGSNTIIKQNTIIKNSLIGSNCIIHENTSIGSTGFGFPSNKGANLLFPHIGMVVIGNNCSIGSNCTIDKAKIDETIIEDNCMIDNQIHIAHNVRLGKNSTIAAQTGISGSVTIGNNFICGGQTGISGHINIGNNVIAAAKSGITKNISDNSIVAGFPATDINKWKKMIIKNRKI